jgi:hypothetical protein
MNLKRKIVASAAALVLAASAGTAAAMSAGAATPSCGPSCIDVFSKQFGTFHHPAFVLDVKQQGARVGQPIILFRTSNSDPAEDFTIANEGQVSDFYAAGLVSSTLALHYGCGLNLNTGLCSDGKLPAATAKTDDYAFELEYAPFGVDSGLCVGTAVTAGSHTPVTLQHCGVSSKTTWIADTIDSCITNPLYRFEVPAINGSSTNFSHPPVLTYPAAGFPTDLPRPQLFTSNLNGFSQSGNGLACGTGSIVGTNSNQLWAAVGGVLH